MILPVLIWYVVVAAAGALGLRRPAAPGPRAGRGLGDGPGERPGGPGVGGVAGGEPRPRLVVVAGDRAACRPRVVGSRGSGRGRPGGTCSSPSWSGSGRSSCWPSCGCRCWPSRPPRSPWTWRSSPRCCGRACSRPPTRGWPGLTLPYYYWGFVPWAAARQGARAWPPTWSSTCWCRPWRLVTAQAAWALARGAGRQPAHRRHGGRSWWCSPAPWTAGASGSRARRLAGSTCGRRRGRSPARSPSSRCSPSTSATCTPTCCRVPLMLVAVFLARALAVPSGSVRRAAAGPPGAGVRGGGGRQPVVRAADRAWPSCWWRSATSAGSSAWRRRRLEGVGAGGGGRVSWAGSLYSPFWLRSTLRPQGFGLVTAGTRVDQFVLLMGAAILPLSWWAGSCRGAGRHRGGPAPALRAAWLAGFVALDRADAALRAGPRRRSRCRWRW